MGIPASRTIEIKKEKLAEELSKPEPDKFIVKRLKESIKRHEKEMRVIKRIQRRKKHGIK